MLGCFIVTGAALQLYNFWRTAQRQRLNLEQGLGVDPTLAELEAR
jgi:hypothetical protein